MPPSDGFYIIGNPSTSSFLGVASDNNTVIGYNTLDKAQVWELRSGQIFTTLKDGKTGSMAYKSNSNRPSGWSIQVVIQQGAGYIWTYTSLGANMWTIFESDPNWIVNAVNVSGLAPQNAQINHGPTTADGRRWLFMPWQPRGPAQAIEDFFSVSSQSMRDITQDMVTTFREGLASPKTPPSAMIPSHVTLLPDGSEAGPCLSLTVADKDQSTLTYFVLDTYFRIKTSKQTELPLTSQELGLEVTALFKIIADRVKNILVDDWRLTMKSDQPLPMGIIFPFPVEKTALNMGILLRWTKEVEATTVDGSTIGEDVVQHLQKALKNEGLHVKCNALINDTTATLLAQAYESRGSGCDIGAIFDTGTNGAYIEAGANIKSLEGISGQMIINTEWGSFDKSQSLPRTIFDNRIDRESAYPGQQMFEKLVSTTAIGELCRHVLLHHLDTALPHLDTALPHLDTTFSLSRPKERPLFNRHSSEKLNNKGAIDIELMWAINAAKDAAAVQKLLVKKLDLLLDNVTVDDGKTVQNICRAILLRTARLSACALAATLILMGRATLGGGVGQGGRIGISGSLTLPPFRLNVEKALREIIGADVEVFIAPVGKERISLGAAVCACLEETREN